MQNNKLQSYLLETLKHKSITLEDNNRTYEDQVSEILTRIANISVGIAWFNRMDVLQARHYTSYMVTVIMVFLDIPISQQNTMVRYMTDSVIGVYYFANGELRSKPTIYAERAFRT